MTWIENTLRMLRDNLVNGSQHITNDEAISLVDEITALNAKLSEKEAEIERLRGVIEDMFKNRELWREDHMKLQMELNQAIEALENISNMDYDAYQGHTHMLYDAQMHARNTLQSIKGGETDG